MNGRLKITDSWFYRNNARILRWDHVNNEKVVIKIEKNKGQLYFE